MQRNWYVVDGTNQTVGRMCAKIASVLRGKNKAYYTPHVDCGDYVIIINAEKIKFTGNKMDEKEYITFSGYPGGQRTEIAKDLLKFQLYHERISARHAGKTGGSMDPNDHMEAVMLFNEYVTFAEQFQANVIPNVQSLSEILARAEAKVVEESGAGALTETQEAFDAIAKGQFNVEFKDKTGPEASPEVAEPVH